MIATAERAIDAERGLIGCLLIDTRDTVIQRAVEANITRDWFTDPKLAHIFQAAFDLYAAGRPVDSVTVQDKLKPAGIIGFEDIDALMDGAITTQHAPLFIKQVCDHHALRETMNILARLTSRGGNLESDEVADFIAMAQEQVCRIGIAERDIRSLADVARDIIADAKQPPEDRAGVPWPWAGWQRRLEPMTDELIYIAARPSVGKTALALNIATHAARAGHRVGFASLESPREKIVARIVQAMSETDFRRLYRNPHSARWPKVDSVPPVLETLPLDIVSEGMSPERLYAWGKAQVARGAELLIVDNMKHIRPSQRYGSTVEMFRDFSARLKWMRDDLGVPLIVLHHLSHELKLSWSDDIERDADAVCFLLRGEPADDGWNNCRTADENNGWVQSVKADFRKFRDSTPGAFYMELCGETQQFTEEAKPETATQGGF